MKYPNIRLGDIEAVWNKLGGPAGVERYLAGETEIITPKIFTALKAPAHVSWTVDADEEGNINFSLISNGMTQEQWRRRLERRGWQMDDWVCNVLSRANEKPTHSVVYNIVVHPGKKLSNDKRIINNIRVMADNRGWVKPHWEVACLIRDTFTDMQLEEMGLWYIVTMHEPIEDSGGGPCLLASYRGAYRGVGGNCFRVESGKPVRVLRDDGGFAFIETQGN